MKTQRHASHIATFWNCGAQFELIYMMGLRAIPRAFAPRGSGTHGGIQKDLEHKILTGELLSLEAVQDYTRDATVAAWEKQGVRLVEDEIERGQAVVKAETIDTAIRLATLHHEQLGPLIDPLHVERPWVLELEGFPVNLAGRIDIQEKAKKIRDTKTKSAAPPAGTADKMIQLTVYSLAVKSIDGFEPEIEVDNLVAGKTPRVITQKTTRSTHDYEMLFRRMEMMERAIEKGVFLPADPGHWLCSPRWCGFYKNGCKYV